MTAEHFIQWAVVETERDALIHWFHPDEAPEAVFALAEGQTAKPSTPTATSTACGRRTCKGNPVRKAARHRVVPGGLFPVPSDA